MDSNTASDTATPSVPEAVLKRQFVETVLNNIADRESNRSASDWRGRLSNWVKC